MVLNIKEENMSVTSGFFDSQNGDRVYNAEQFGSLFDGIINDGVLMNVGKNFKVTPASGLSVYVDTGRAWFNSTWILNDAKEAYPLDSAHMLLNRIDAIVIEVDRSLSVRAATIKVIKGVEASTPVKPTLTNAGQLHQYPVAYVTIRANATTLLQADIEITVGTDACKYANALLETVSASSLLLQWDSQFSEWFSNLQDELDENQAAHLQNEINRVVAKTSVTLLAEGWTREGNDQPWVQEVNAASVEDGDDPIYSMGTPATETVSSYTNMKAAYAKIDKVIASAGKLTFYVYNATKPTVDIVVNVKGY